MIRKDDRSNAKRRNDSSALANESNARLLCLSWAPKQPAIARLSAVAGQI